MEKVEWEDLEKELKSSNIFQLDKVLAFLGSKNTFNCDDVVVKRSQIIAILYIHSQELNNWDKYHALQNEVYKILKS